MPLQNEVLPSDRTKGGGGGDSQDCYSIKTSGRAWTHATPGLEQKLKWIRHCSFQEGHVPRSKLKKCFPQCEKKPRNTGDIHSRGLFLQMGRKWQGVYFLMTTWWHQFVYTDDAMPHQVNADHWGMAVLWALFMWRPRCSKETLIKLLLKTEVSTVSLDSGAQLTLGRISFPVAPVKNPTFVQLTHEKLQVV